MTAGAKGWPTANGAEVMVTTEPGDDANMVENMSTGKTTQFHT